MNKQYKSHFQEGRMPTLLYVTRQDYNARQLVRPMHNHKGLTEFIFVFEGKGWYNIGSKHYEIGKGDVLLYNPGALHEIIPNDQDPIGSYCFGLRDLYLEGLEENHLTLPGHGFVRHTHEHFDEIFHMSRTLFLELNEERAYTREFCHHLLTALLLLVIHLPQSSSNDMKSSDYLLVDRIKLYIDDHFRENLAIPSIAAALDVSSSYISHTFKEATGYPIMQYVRRRRIGEAETLLINSNAKVTDIAIQVGFNDSNYFNTVFSKIVGFTPLQYRKRYHELQMGKRVQ